MNEYKRTIVLLLSSVAVCDIKNALLCLMQTPPTEMFEHDLFRSIALLRSACDTVIIYRLHYRLM
jgi:hypothetical protein